MKILLTGSAGFIGYHLAKKLLENGHEVLGIDNLNDYYNVKLKKDRLQNLKPFNSFSFKKVDISIKSTLLEVFKDFKPERVINLAAQPGVRYSLINPYAYIDSNITGFLNILELSKEFKVDGLLYASSSSVYGNNKIPFSESDLTEKPISLYGATKKTNELLAYTYSHLYGINISGLRYFTVYGPWYRPDMAMHIFANKILKGETIEVFNNGKMNRDFTYIDDIVDGTISALNENHSFEIFNLGNSKTENLVDVINLIETSLGVEAKIIFKPIQPGDVFETYADINHSKKKLNFSPKTSIQVGVPKFIEWFRSYYEI